MPAAGDRSPKSSPTFPDLTDHPQPLRRRSAHFVRSGQSLAGSSVNDTLLMQ